MGWAVKYSKQFQRMGVTKTYRVDILSEAGGPVITPYKMGADPFQLKTLGAERDEDKIVIGSEVTFEFVLQKRLNETDYDPLFESEYREHIVKFYDDDTSTLLWQGYLQPENMYRSMFESNLHIYLSASDGLKDLSDFDFDNAGAIITGHISGLQIIKYCLTKLVSGAEFQYNFIIKLGTKHDGQGANDTALKDVTHDTRRFVKVVDGKTEFDSCLTVIEKVLKSYSCTLQQYGGKYYILSRHETATNYYTYNWALVFQSKAASSDVINIDTYKFKRDADVSFISPIKQIGLRLLNRNIGDNAVLDIDNFDEVTGPWDYTNYTGAYDDSGATMLLTAEAGVWDNGYMTLKNDAAIQKLTEGDYMKLRFNYLSITTGVSERPNFSITAIKDGVEYPAFGYYFTDGDQQYESEVSAAFKLVGNIGDTYDYNFKLVIHSNDFVVDYEVELKNFTFNRAVYIDEENQADITFDSFHRGTNTDGKIKAEDIDMYFGDSPTLGDFAGLIYSGSQTDEWNREGEADAASLMYLWLKNYLISRQSYNDYIICSIKDSGDNITPINYIEFNSKKYHIVSYDKSFRTSWIALHLKEWKTADITISYEEIYLTSVDGENAGGTQVININSGGSYSHNSLTGIQGGLAGQYYHFNASEYTELHDWLDNVTLGNDGKITVPGGNSDQWTDAFGWGDHAGAGYAVKAADETITGYWIFEHDSSPGVRFKRDTVWNDGFWATFGTDLDSYISWSGQIKQLHQIDYFAGNTYFEFSGKDAGGTNRTLALMYPRAGCEFYYTGTKRLETTATGVTVTGELITDSNVGIGTISPSRRLSIKSNADSAYLSFNPNDVEEWVIGSDGASGAGTDNFIIFDATTGGYRLVINPNGYVGINDITPSYYLDVNGTGRFTGDLYGDSSVQHLSFISGWDAGTNWQIQADGDAEFRNVMITGGLQVYELIINQLHYQNGGLIIGAGAGKVATIVDATQGAEVVTFHDPEGTAIVPFTAGSIIMIQRVDINRTSVVKKIVRQVYSIVGMQVTFEATAGWTPAVDDVGVFELGDEACAIGHTTTAGLQNSIFMSATDSDNPFLRVLTEVDSYADWGTDARVKCQIGNLASLASFDVFGDASFVMPASPGYGIFTSNGYFSGMIKATSGKIGTWNLNSTSIYTGTEDHSGYTANSGDITIYSDGSDASIHAYNFYINNEGKIFAKAGEIGGFTIDATSLAATVAGANTGIESDTGKFLWITNETYCLSQQSTPVTLSAPVPYVVALDNNSESTLNLPAAGLPGSGSSTQMYIIHAKGTGLGANKYHINGNGYNINRNGVQAASFDLTEGEAVLLVWDSRQSGQWYVIG